MSELLTSTPERKLWYDGPNYTADAVIIDTDAGKILLIERGDGGGWALPGGFIDPDDDSGYSAAIREAREEASVDIGGYAPCVFKGTVDDPRNTESAWIETSAYLFSLSSETNTHAADDAQAAAWHDLSSLPRLYASHQSIIKRALDHLAGRVLIDAFSSPESFDLVDGGHMEYEKFVFKKNDKTVFAKQHNIERFTDYEKAERSFTYLEKEARTMAHLREHGFCGVPERSTLHVNTLIMDALTPEAGWQWHAETETVKDYVGSALELFSELEEVPIPRDAFPIEPSYDSFIREGWQSFDDIMHEKLEQRLHDFLPHLRPHSQETVRKLFADLPSLQRAGLEPHAPERLVFCHHDVRQSNLAWHPKHGTRLVDWSWAGIGEPNSDSTSLLIDLHKSGHDITPYRDFISPRHCLVLMGFWLGHSTWPYRGNDTVRLQQFVSVLSAYELLMS